MWWNHAKTRVATSIVNVQFWHSTCKKRIRNFKAPVNILMEVKNITKLRTGDRDGKRDGAGGLRIHHR
jgi:putative component of toxin-antitoxin plasmid stabilization module